jgi:hypothetical protein
MADALLTPVTQRKGLLSQLADDDSYQYFLDNGDDAWKLMAKKFIADHGA